MLSKMVATAVLFLTRSQSCDPFKFGEIHVNGSRITTINMNQRQRQPLPFFGKDQGQRVMLIVFRTGQSESSPFHRNLVHILHFPHKTQKYTQNFSFITNLRYSAPNFGYLRGDRDLTILLLLTRLNKISHQLLMMTVINATFAHLANVTHRQTDLLQQYTMHCIHLVL